MAFPSNLAPVDQADFFSGVVVIADADDDRTSWERRWLTDGGAGVFFPAPQPEHCREWRDALKAVLISKEDQVVIGRGLAASLILDLLRKGELAQIGGALLVDPVAPEISGADFALPSLPLGLPVIILHEYRNAGLALEQLRALCNMWEATFIELRGFRLDFPEFKAGKGRWPEGDELLRRLAGLWRLQGHHRNEAA